MDLALTVPFSSVLTSLMLRAMGSTTSPTANDRALMTDGFTEAMRWAWEEPGQPWPDTREGASVSVTDGVITLASVFYANWFEIYNIDPRPQGVYDWWKISSRRDAGGIWPNTQLTTLFVLFQRRAPEFTTVLVNKADTYSLDDLVYDNNTGDSAATGDCYKCVGASASPADTASLQNPAYWERQLVPKFLKAAVLQYAQYMWARSKSKEDEADTYRAMAATLLDQQYFKYFVQAAQ